MLNETVAVSVVLSLTLSRAFDGRRPTKRTLLLISPFSLATVQNVFVAAVSVLMISLVAFTNEIRIVDGPPRSAYCACLRAFPANVRAERGTACLAATGD